MAQTIVYYRKVVNGIGYRFALPLLAPPSCAGDLVDVEVAIFLNAASDRLYAPPSNAVEASKYLRDLESCVTLDVSAAGAYWFLPLLEPEPAGKGNEQVFKVKVRRAVAPQSGPTQQAAAPAAPSSPLARPSESAASPASHTQASPAATVASQASLQVAASSRAAVVTTRDSTTSQEAGDTYTGFVPPKSYGDEIELGLNAAYDYKITQSRWVDTLPQGDRPQGEHLDPRLLKPKGWSASKVLGTWFRLTKIRKAARSLDWAELTGEGVPCKVRKGTIEVRTRGCPERSLKTTSTTLRDGDALYKLVPIEKSQYACQPAAAFAEASYILNTYHIVIEQDGKQYRAFEPAGEVLDFDWQRHLGYLGEYASAECGSSIIYSHDSHWDGETEPINAFGVRLRDGGARLPLRSKPGSRDVFEVELPGIKALFYDWGACTELGDDDDDDDGFGSIVVDVRLSLPPAACDLLLRVEERQDGDYREVKYMLRRRSSYRPIREDEWLRLTTDVVDAGAKRYMLNVARSTFDRDPLEEAAEEQGSSAPKKHKK